MAFFAQPFHKFQSKTAQSVVVGNHKFGDTTFENVVQKGFKVWAVPVETASDIADDGMVRVMMVEEIDLSLQIGALMFRGDACVTDFLERLFIGGDTASLRRNTKDCGNIVGSIEAFSSGHGEGANASIAMPLFARLTAECVRLVELAERNPLSRRFCEVRWGCGCRLFQRLLSTFVGCRKIVRRDGCFGRGGRGGCCIMDNFVIVVVVHEIFSIVGGVDFLEYCPKLLLSNVCVWKQCYEIQ